MILSNAFEVHSFRYNHKLLELVRHVLSAATSLQVREDRFQVLLSVYITYDGVNFAINVKENVNPKPFLHAAV